MDALRQRLAGQGRWLVLPALVAVAWPLSGFVGAEIGVTLAFPLVALAAAVALIALREVRPVRSSPVRAVRQRAAPAWGRRATLVLACGPVAACCALAIGLLIAIKADLPEADRLLTSGYAVPIIWTGLVTAFFCISRIWTLMAGALLVGAVAAWVAIS